MHNAGCFLCAPQVIRTAETAWNWSSPRSLCSAHGTAYQLPDGQSLKYVLHLVKPNGAPLEGSLLGWIFNPVYVDGNVRAWADFVAGGVIVFEDRFNAQNYFEYWALDTTRGMDVLHLLQLIGPADGKIESFMGFAEASLSLYLRNPAVLPPEGLRRTSDGLAHLISVWNIQKRLAQLRNHTRRLWPDTFAELESWIAQCRERGSQLDPATEAEFFRTLVTLSASSKVRSTLRQ